MERFVYKQLIDWKCARGRKPLVLNGARQVGKTWLLKEFAQREYAKMAYVMCRKNLVVKEMRLPFSGCVMQGWFIEWNEYQNQNCL